MKYLIFLLLVTLPSISNAAAPNDINTNQRAWFDAVDLDANNDYTNNPANNTSVSEWRDKSGTNNHISQTGTARPLYVTDSISTEKHGIEFDGTNDVLSHTSDIWTGAVTNSESYVVATTDQIKASFLFLSTTTGNQRIGVHAPWSNNTTYFDHGYCCSSPARLQGSIPINLFEHNIWHFTGSPDAQEIAKDGKLNLSDGSAGTYTVDDNAKFTLSNYSSLAHHGTYFEAIFYQASLNTAQRSILHNYLSAKWDKAFDTLPNYSDIYDGDSIANGDYDYFVGGMGQDNGSQSIATSQGLTITDDSFLTEDGKYILAGVNYLVTTPLIGTTTSDVPSGYFQRSNRSWYIDRTGDDGLVKLSFDADEVGLQIDNGASYGLLQRTGTSGTFSEVDSASMVNGVIDFSYLPADGVYVIGKKGSVALSIDKVSQTVKDPINLLLNPKSIPGSNTDYTLTVRNTGDGMPDAETTIIRDTIPAELTLFTGDLDASGSPFVFTDNSCAPTTSTSSSNLTLDYPVDVVFKDAADIVLIPSIDYDSSVRSFEITLSGTMNASANGMVPCFTIRYRTQLD